MPHNRRSSQLIHIDVDRRLGHEWDEWDGKPLPGGGDFSAPPSRFFWFAALTIAVLAGPAFFLAYLLVPRLDELWEPARAVLFIPPGAALRRARPRRTRGHRRLQWPNGRGPES